MSHLHGHHSVSVCAFKRRNSASTHATRAMHRKGASQAVSFSLGFCLQSGDWLGVDVARYRGEGGAAAARRGGESEMICAQCTRGVKVHIQAANCAKCARGSAAAG